MTFNEALKITLPLDIRMLEKHLIELRSAENPDIEAIRNIQSNLDFMREKLNSIRNGDGKSDPKNNDNGADSDDGGGIDCAGDYCEFGR